MKKHFSGPVNHSRYGSTQLHSINKFFCMWRRHLRDAGLKYNIAFQCCKLQQHAAKSRTEFCCNLQHWHLLGDKLLAGVAIRATKLCNLQSNNVARQVARKCCPYHLTFNPACPIDPYLYNPVRLVDFSAHLNRHLRLTMSYMYRLKFISLVNKNF